MAGGGHTITDLFLERSGTARSSDWAINGQLVFVHVQAWRGGGT